MEDEMNNKNNQEEETKSSTPTNTAIIAEKKEEVVDLKTIMPTMIDEEDDDKFIKKQDISAIVPQSISLGPQEGEKLHSQSELLKSDGSIVLGTVSGEGIAMSEKAALPEQIDIEARKKEAKELREGKKKKGKTRDISKAKEEMRSLNKKTLLVLFLIAVVIGLTYYVIKNPGIREFQPIALTIELGEKLPIHSKDYVVPGSGQVVDDVTFIVDTSNVNPEVVGEYQYTVKHGNVVKIGRIKIVDTTPPELYAKDLVITEGISYAATDFIESCYDFSGCEYSFEEEGAELKYTKPGDYSIYVIAQDIYNNKTVKQVSLTIEERGKVKYFIKEEPFDNTLGYALTTKYELHFTDVNDAAVILNGKEIKIYDYNDKETYDKVRKEKYGTENAKVDDDKLTITEENKANKIGDNERYEYVIEYLLKNGFRETNANFD